MAQSEDIAEDILNTIKPKKRRWPWVVVVVFILGIIAFVAVRGGQSNEVKTSYKTAALDRGDITLKATSTGNLEPRRQVTIGAEISGQVTEVFVEENDQVKAGQVLAKIDVSRTKNERAQLVAQLQGARASVKRVKATIEELDISIKRTKSLVQQGASPQSDLDTLDAQLARAKADLSSAYADVNRVQASIEALDADMAKATITSPIDGVVLSRDVEPGTTVAASFQAPELFILAEDLSKMELHVLINEADISLVQTGQKANFLVDAWPTQTFEATVKSVSFSPTETNNVISYKTVLSVDNSEHLLRPGMTATTEIQTGTKENVLRVPLEALWFEPAQEEESGFRLGPPRRDRSEKKGSSVYVLRNNQPVQIGLKLGRSDESYMEVLDGDIKEGDLVITGTDDPKPPQDKAPEQNKEEGK